MPGNSSTDLQEPGKLHGDSLGLDNDRVRRFTFQRDLERIDGKTRDSVRHHSNLGNDAISARLEELNGEWPVDRALMTGAGTFIWLGLILGTAVKRRLYLISAIAGGILLLYAFFGWAPPVMILRRLGFRTRAEIDLERIALKALRGDFDRLSDGQPDSESRISRAMKAAS